MRTTLTVPSVVASAALVAALTGVAPRAQASSTPFSGSPLALPGTVQAEHFDHGGPNVAYRDNDAGNNGAAYRSTDVDIQPTTDVGGGFNVGWIGAGEWLQYTVKVAASGTYTLEARVASPQMGGTFHVRFDGVDRTGSIQVPATGGWQAWTTVKRTVTLAAGTQYMRVVFDTNGSSGAVGNLNWIRLVSAGTSGSTPFTGAPIALPGTVQAQNFDHGGQHVAYRDLSPGNAGGAYRNTDVDIEATKDASGSYNIGWMAAGEWLQYTVSVPAAGSYTLQVRVASTTAGGRFHVAFDGIDKTGLMTMPNTGGWQSWTTLSTPVTLAAGTQKMRFVVDANAPNGLFGNLNWLAVSSAAPSSTLFRAPFLQQVTSADARVVWGTRAAGKAQVRYQAAGQGLRTAAAVSTLFTRARTGLAHDYYQHAAVLSPLTPSTVYTYDVLLDGTDLTPVVDRFRTAPLAGTGAVRVLAWADSGVGSTAQRQLAVRMAAESFDLALHAGDVAYGQSNTWGGGSHQTLHDWFFSIYRDWLRRVPVYPSIGNHDDEISFGQPYRDVFVLPANGATAAYPDHAERFYSFDYGPVHFVALDSERAFQDPARRAAQLAWLDDDLTATAQPWKIAYFHRSPYSSGTHHGSNLALRQAFAPVFERHGVQLVISAHDHTYERGVPWRWSTAASGRAVTYVVSGGGGAPLYGVSQSAWTARSASTYHYLRVHVEGCTLRLDAVGLDGVAFDTWTLDRCAQELDRQPPTVAITSPASGASVGGRVTVAVTASDDIRVEKVDLWVDGRLVAIDRTAPYSFVWDTRSVSDGSRRLEARAYDSAGRIAVASRTVQVSNGSATSQKGFGLEAWGLGHAPARASRSERAASEASAYACRVRTTPHRRSFLRTMSAAKRPTSPIADRAPSSPVSVKRVWMYPTAWRTRFSS